MQAITRFNPSRDALSSRRITTSAPVRLVQPRRCIRASSSNDSSAAVNSTPSTSGAPATAGASGSLASKYGWKFDAAPEAEGKSVRLLPVAAIIRPLGRTRGNDQDKVAALMESIQDIGLQEPIDVLEVEGQYYGFSGCHRYEAHQRLGLEMIKCRIRKANREILRMHMM